MHRGRLFRRTLMYALGCGLLAFGLAVSARAQCQLNSPGGKIKHVVYVELDNWHFTRDNPNVPSDLEQMPNLLNFITQNGTLDAGDHTVLISHTANDILTTQIGLYSDHHGIFVANSFGVFGPGNGLPSIFFPSSFFYWTDLVSDIKPGTKDNTFALTTPSGQNVPAPWVPFTRAGCDVGAFSTANIVLERTPFDVQKVFGVGSPQAGESSGDQFNDFIGASIHCAVGSPLCTAANGAVADLLPDEPGGYIGYEALFGLKYIAPALGGLTDYHGSPITGFGAIGFDPVPAQTLAVVETMLKKGIPIVFAYIADAHDNRSSEGTFGPGEAGYVQQLSDYNAAFGTFFANLKAAGIDQSNTLFIFTPDEGDHFAGGPPSPANCDGVTTPCTYPPNPVTGAPGIGELDFNLNGAVANAGDTTPFSIHFDDAPTVYVPGQPLPSDSSVRQLERTMAGLSAVNPHTGLSESLLGNGLGPELQGALADPVAQKLLHMNSLADAARSPTFTFFGNPNFFFLSFGSSTTPTVGTGFAWNHGSIQPEIARTFIGIVGPGVNNLGVTGLKDFFTDHVDVRPTMMFLTGLQDDYEHDGRVILELLDPNALPISLHAYSHTLLQLGQIYKQIDAPFGDLAESTLKVSTYAIESDSAGDAVYNNLENQIASWTAQRDALTAQIQSMLEAAEFSGQPIDELEAFHIIVEGHALLGEASFCASNPQICALFWSTRLAQVPERVLHPSLSRVRTFAQAPGAASLTGPDVILRPSPPGHIIGGRPVAQHVACAPLSVAQPPLAVHQTTVHSRAGQNKISAMMPTRNDAWTLLCEFTQNENLRKHALAVEACVRAYARKSGADENLWGLAALLHDFDYERWPNQEHHPSEGHPSSGTKILRERGYPEEMLRAILAHADYTGVPRETPLDRALFACDEMAGFLTACSLVKPGKTIFEVEADSVKRKMKDKAFARGVRREDLTRGAQELGVPLEDHIATCIAAMRAVAPSLGLEPKS